MHLWYRCWWIAELELSLPILWPEPYAANRKANPQTGLAFVRVLVPSPIYSEFALIRVSAGRMPA